MDHRGHWEGKQGEEWVMLERFVFRRDGGDKPLPENETTASSSTCICVRFRVSLGLVSPPSPSRFYLEWPGGPDPNATIPCELVAAHRDCVLFRLTSFVRTKTHPQRIIYGDDYFIYRPSAANLQRLPNCPCFPAWARPVAIIATEQERKQYEPESFASASEEFVVPDDDMLWARMAERGELERTLALGVEVDEEDVVVGSPLVMECIGLLCGGDGDEFVVAELLLDKSNHKVSADVSLLHSSRREWVPMPQLPIQCNNSHDSAALRCFGTRAVVPFGDSLCWADHNAGIIFAQGILEQAPKLSFIPLPLKIREGGYCSVCATDGGNSLKFVAVVVDKPQQPYSFRFTIRSYKLITAAEGHLKWEEENPMTSEELWGLQAPGRVPHEVPMFPLVSLDKPHIVHFQLIECTDYLDTVTVVTIDMSARTVVSVLTHLKGEQELNGEDADVAEARTSLPQPFLPVTFSKSLLCRPVNLTSKRKDQS